MRELEARAAVEEKTPGETTGRKDRGKERNV